MRPPVLQIFNRYLEYGGEEGSVGRIASTLRLELPLETYYGSTEEILQGASGKLRMPFTMLRNERVLGELEALQRERSFAFWQIHNVFPAVSVAVYELARMLQVPVVQYLHNYRFGCPAATYFTRGEPCHRCSPGHFGPGVIRRCWRQSLPATVAMGFALRRFWRRGMCDGIQTFIAISHRQKELHAEMGIPVERIHVLPHFLEAGEQPEEAPPPDGDVVFFGRITEEKGVGLLIRAWARVCSGSRFLRIVGVGPELGSLKALVDRLGLTNVRFEGFVPREEHPAIWRDAAFSVAPSIWEEPFGMVVLEAWRQGRPVLATNHGSFPEMIRHGTDGWLAPVDLDGFTQVLQEAIEAGTRYATMGLAGRDRLEQDYTRGQWLERIIGIYREDGLIEA